MPCLDELQVPLFETEGKKLQTQAKPTSKTTVAPAIEGTSVMPRQRPKASSSTPLNLTNLPLALSPSPTAKKSQSPVVSNTDNQFQSFQTKTNTVQQTFSTNNSQIFPSAATTQSFSPAFQHTQFFSSQESSEKTFENLFQSSIYSDPFRDDGTSTPSISKKSSYEADSVNSPVSPNLSYNSSTHVLSAPKQGLVESASQCVMGTANTPPTSPTLSIQKGHRRNMSDTSAFNK